MAAGLATALREFSRNREMLGALVLGLAVLTGAAILLRRSLRSRPTAEEIERRRRSSTHRFGKLGDGEIIDVAETAIVYSYSVAGVGYTASQDVTGLESLLPEDRMTLIGPVSLKYMAKNPANSVVLCEEWNGLRRRGAKGL